jgi:hypothetical protein
MDLEEMTKKRRLESAAKSSIPTSALVVTEIVQQKQKTTATKPPKLSHRHRLSVLLPSLSFYSLLLLLRSFTRNRAQK